MVDAVTLPLAASLMEQLQHWWTYLTGLDFVIIAMGSILIALHLFVGVVAIKPTPRSHRSMLSLLGFCKFATEILPLLGMIGTALALLQTLAVMREAPTFSVSEITGNFAPALTTTASGLIFAVINLLLNGVDRHLLGEQVTE